VCCGIAPSMRRALPGPGIYRSGFPGRGRADDRETNDTKHELLCQTSHRGSCCFPRLYHPPFKDILCPGRGEPAKKAIVPKYPNVLIYIKGSKTGENPSKMIR